ncbi:MAG: type IV secretion system protein [Alphaproteobacteria bacterium]|nr:type IV secretion system protein [Alphaproteobacteria bacterium]
MAEKGEGASDVFTGWAILGVILLAFAWLLWWIWGDQIANIVRWYRYAQMWVISFILPDDYTIIWRGFTVNFHEWLDRVATMPASQIDLKTLGLFSTLALTPWKYIFSALIFAMGIWAYTKGPGTHYRTKLDLTGLIRHQSKVFPMIAPFVKFDPSKRPPRAPGSPVPAELPLFAEALGPEEWLAYHVIPVPGGKIDKDAVAKAFSQQLGKRWKGVKGLAPYQEILLAGFCLKAARKRHDSDELLGRLSQCWSHDKGLKINRGLLRDARKILANKDISGKTLAKCHQHAFETTALMRALMTAREEGGVLAPAQFLWLRGYDRALWYPLNNLGRNSYHMEAMGAMAHYKAEKLAQRPIPQPKIDGAVQAISEYMSSDRARPIPQLDYTGSKKRGIKQLKTA